MEWRASGSCVAAGLWVAAGLAVPAPAFAYAIVAGENGQQLRWSVDTVPFRLDPALEQLLPEGQILAAAQMAFDAWRGLPRVPDLVLRPGVPASPGHHVGSETNGMYLIRDWTGKPKQLAVTLVTYEGATGHILDADILVNADGPYALLDESGPVDPRHYDLGAILTHEAGHSLGLDDSDSSPAATMWPLINPGDTYQRMISEDDEAGVIANYAGALAQPSAGCGPASVLGRPAQRDTAFWLVLSALALLLWFARRAQRSMPRRTLAFGLGGVLLASPVGQAAEGSCVTTRATAARLRIEQAFGDGFAQRAALLGRARSLGARWQNGLIVTRHTVRDVAGVEHRIETLGGEIDGIGQWVSDSAPAPVEGAELVLGTAANGVTSWAYHHDGILFGGWLGDGPSIRIKAKAAPIPK
jgi:hypothetical protein